MVVLEIALGVVWLHVLYIFYQCLLVGSLGVALGHFDVHLYTVVGNLLGLFRLYLGLLLLAETVQESGLNVAVLILITLIYYYSITVVLELYGLSGRVVEHQCFFFLGLLVLWFILSGSVNGELYLIIIDCGVEHLADEHDCSCAEVGQECYSDEYQ